MIKLVPLNCFLVPLAVSFVSISSPSIAQVNFNDSALKDESKMITFNRSIVFNRSTPSNQTDKIEQQFIAKNTGISNFETTIDFTKNRTLKPLVSGQYLCERMKDGLIATNARSSTSAMIIYLFHAPNNNKCVPKSPREWTLTNGFRLKFKVANNLELIWFDRAGQPLGKKTINQPGVITIPDISAGFIIGWNLSTNYQSGRRYAYLLDSISYSLLLPKKPKDLCQDERYIRLLDERLHPTVKQKLDSDPNRGLQPLGTRRTPSFAKGVWANYDEDKITIPNSKLPTNFNPQVFLQDWAKNMNAVPVGQGKSVFDSVNIFQQRPENYRPLLGDVIDINIVLGTPFVGKQIEGRADVIIKNITPTYFQVATLTYYPDKKPTNNIIDRINGSSSDWHPVSGTREFGFEEHQNGSITFYTRGLDNPRDFGSQYAGVSQQVKGWTAFMQGIGERFGVTLPKEQAEDESFYDSISQEPSCHIKPF